MVADQGQTLTAGIREDLSGNTKTHSNVILDILSAK